MLSQLLRGVIDMKHLSFITKKLTAAAASAVMAVTSVFYPTSVVTSSAETNNYYEALAMSLYMYDANACGKGITDGPLTWRGDCHTYDAEASVGDLDGSLKSAVDSDGDGKVDVSGGFHDAGDHIKFNLTIGFGICSLALSDYLNPGVYEKAGCKDHLIYELKRGADYLMKTTFLDSSGKVAAIAHVVANGGEDHAIWSSPEVQTYKRPIYWLTSNKNNSAVCCEMAAGLAGTAYVVKESDPEYAEKCMKYAKALLEFGQKHVGNEGGGLADFYGTEAQYQDEEALAQAWLWLSDAGSKPTRVPKNKDYGDSQYDGWVYCWNKVWQGYSALMYKATGDQVFADELKVELQSQGDLKVGTYNADGWGASRYNCAKQMDALALANGDADADYAKAAKYQMDHILGNNSLGYSFLLGYGSKWPVHIHHRAANPGTDANGASSNPSAKYTAYGLLVGGDDKNGYQDQTDKYQYTEGALDYNGCFVIACAGIANLYGGDATAMPALAKKADEINENFKFGDSTPVNKKLVLSVDKEEWHEGETITIHAANVPDDTITVSAPLGVDFFPLMVDEGTHTTDIMLTAKEGSHTITVSYSDGTAIQFEKITIKVLPALTTTTSTAPVTTTTATTTPSVPKATHTVRAEYYVQEVISYPTKTIYNVGEDLDFTGISLKICSQTRWMEVDGNRAGTFYGTPQIVDDITISAKDVSICDKNGTVYKGEMANTLSAGEYYVTANKTIYSDKYPVGIHLLNYSQSITYKEASDTIKVNGDTNCDGQVDMADAVLIMQALANPNKYGLDGTAEKHLTAQGKINGDMDGDGLTVGDALTIQKLLLGLDIDDTK